MTIVEIGVDALRVVASILALCNLPWTAPGARELMRGRFRPPEIYMSVVFWMAVAVLVFQAAYLAGQTPLWRLFAYVILSVSMGVALVGYRLGAALKARQFYAMYDHLADAMAIVDLARIDPEAAARQAAECRRLTAAMVVAND